MHTCPQCGFDIQDSNMEVCANCKFDFNDTLSCPYKISNRCVHTHKECKVYGLAYEDCQMYLHKSGIKGAK